MKTIKINIVAVLAALLLTSCATAGTSTSTVPTATSTPTVLTEKTIVPSPTQSVSRSIILNEITLTETALGKFNSWKCKDYIDNTSTLVEVGLFADTDLEGVGFILYDGSNSGEPTNYERRGINHRWDWGPNDNDYTFVIEPDGTGIYYDFSSAPDGESVKANAIYKCYRS